MKKMLRQPIAAYGSLLLIITLLIIGCRKTPLSEFPKNDSLDDLEMFARRLGVDASSIKDSGDLIIVGGDMLFRKNTLIAATTMKRQVVAKTDNGRLGFGDGPITSNRGDIKVYISRDLGAAAEAIYGAVADRYEGAIRQAILNFNTIIPFTSLKMREVATSAACDIKVHLVPSLPGGKSGMGYYPVNGNPGTDVYLNLANGSGYTTVAAATLLATHELGHAIGLFHTDETPINAELTESWSFGFFYLKHIPGTPYFGSSYNPAPDPNSFINQFNYAGPEWTQTLSNPGGVGFSNFDIAAIQYLYPLYWLTGASYCYGSSYSIDGLPPGATISWNASPSGIVGFPSGGPNPVFAFKGWDGYADISATVTIGGVSFVVGPSQQPIGAAPALDIIGLDPSIALYGGQYVTLHVNEFANAYSWTVGGGTIIGSSTGRYVTIKLDNCSSGQTTPNTLNVSVVLDTQCGISPPYYESAIPGVVCNGSGGGEPFDPGEIL